MINGKYEGMRNWLLGAVATGMMIPSMPVFGQSKPLFSNPKKPAAKPTSVQPTEPPQLLAVPEGASSASSQIIPAGGEKSEVQKQLDAMYEQDGREPPTFSLQPMTPLNAQPQKSAPPQQTNPAPTGQTRPSQPNVAPTQKPARPAQGYTQYQPRTQATPYPAQPMTNGQRPIGAAIETPMKPPLQAQTQPQTQAQNPPQNQQSRGPINSLFRRITGQNKYVASQAPLPPDVPATASAAPPISTQPTAPAMPIAAKYSVQPRMPVQPVRPMSPPNLATTPVQIRQSASVQITAGTNSIPAELPGAVIGMPALADAPLPLAGISQPSSLPPLMTEPQGSNISVRPAQVTRSTNPAAEETASDFPNPFTEMTETEADSAKANPSKRPAASIDVPESTRETRDVERNSPSDAAAKTDEDPFAVKAKDFSEPSIDEKLAPGATTVVPQEPQPLSPPESVTVPELSAPQALDPPTKADPIAPFELTPPSGPIATPPSGPIVAPPSVAPTVVDPPAATVDPQVEKMKRIRERFGMKGLKGFCPVTLHDERELIDARPEFHFTHRNQKFHFATAEARDKFGANPAKYAPAAYGADVVALSRDKDVVEGTLDFAAWFKGRLYLFGTQSNYDVFIASPAKYATLAEIE